LSASSFANLRVLSSLRVCNNSVTPV
jgi:hypothetical protein